MLNGFISNKILMPSSGLIITLPVKLYVYTLLKTTLIVQSAYQTSRANESIAIPAILYKN